MDFQMRSMTEEDGSLICEWRYPPPYDRYRWLSWEQMKREMREFGDPAIRAAQYRSVRSGRDDELIAYVQLFPLDRAVRIGLGLRPDLCGCGHGGAVIRLAVQEALRCKPRPDAEIDLEVETWNKRAIRAYEKAGFVPESRYDRQAEHGVVQVLCMVWQPSASAPKGEKA